jgi:hypothetical protein
VDSSAKYKLEVHPADCVDPDPVEIGQQYWSLSGVDQYGEPQWGTPVKAIDTLGCGPANVVAAAAVHAIWPDVLSRYS